MKTLLHVLPVLVLIAGLSSPTLAEKEKARSEGMLTAIDVAALMEKGTGDADIARRLFEQRGSDRASAPPKGMTDEQKIYYLLARPSAEGVAADKGQAARHKADGESLYKVRQYDKAAKEFSIAMGYAPNDNELYKLRGDSYRQYLAANLSPSSTPGEVETSQPLLGRKRRLICNSMYSDYRTASALVDKNIRDGVAEMNRLRDRMTELKQGADPNAQYKKKAAENIISMRRMQRILYQQRSAKIDGISINKALVEYKTVCAREDAERVSRIRHERDRARDGKWVRYAENDETTSFYDKSNLQKSKGTVTVWSRKENTADETSHDLARVRLDCKQTTIGTLESASYDAAGKPTLKKKFDNAVMKKVAPGSADELLLGILCK